MRMNTMDNIDTYYPLMGDMDHEPLVSTTPSNKVQSTTIYLNFLSFLVGSCMCVVHIILVSQILLTAHLETVAHGFILGLGLTAWTCFVYLLGMRVWLRMVQERLQECSKANLFVMEAHYTAGCIPGSLLGTIISLMPQVSSLINSAPLVASLAVAGMLLWFPLMLCLIPNNKRSTDVGDNSKTRNKKEVTFSRTCGRHVVIFLTWTVLDYWIYNARENMLTWMLLLILLLVLSMNLVLFLPNEECDYDYDADDDTQEERESIV
jgi:hypothetical protein